jgi:hypothetical protein
MFASSHSFPTLKRGREVYKERGMIAAGIAGCNVVTSVKISYWGGIYA